MCHEICTAYGDMTREECVLRQDGQSSGLPEQTAREICMSKMAYIAGIVTHFCIKVLTLGVRLDIDTQLVKRFLRLIIRVNRWLLECGRLTLGN